MLLFSFKSETGADQRDELLEALAALPSRFPKMTDLQIGPNMSRRDATFSYGMTCWFEDEDALDAYLNSEFHERFVSERFRPLIAQRVIVSLRC